MLKKQEIGATVFRSEDIREGSRTSTILVTDTIGTERSAPGMPQILCDVRTRACGVRQNAGFSRYVDRSTGGAQCKLSTAAARSPHQYPSCVREGDGELGAHIPEHEREQHHHGMEVEAPSQQGWLEHIRLHGHARRARVALRPSTPPPSCRRCASLTRGTNKREGVREHARTRTSSIISR